MQEAAPESRSLTHRLRIDRERVKFPSHCLRCAGPAQGCTFVDATIPSWSVFVRRAGFWRGPARVRRVLEVPLCLPCTGANTARKLGWSVLALAVFLGVIGGGAVLAEAMLPPEVARAWAGGVAIALIALGSLAAWGAATLGLRRHERRWAPVHRVWDASDATADAGGVIVLGFPSSVRAREVAVASGLEPATQSYREAVREAVYRPRGSVFWGLLPLVGACVSTVQVIAWWRGTPFSIHFVEALLEDLFGPWGPIAFWSFGVVLFSVMTLVWARDRFRTPTED